MPAAVSLEVAYDRLYNFLPDWHVGLTKPEWIQRWIDATGDSRATAYRIQNLALEIDDAEFQLRWQHPCAKCNRFQPITCDEAPRCGLLNGSI